MTKRCEFRDDSFNRLFTWNGDRTDQCWMTSTVKQYEVEGNDKHLCCFHMPVEEITAADEEVQAKTLKHLIQVWNKDEQKNSFVMPYMQCGVVNFNRETFKSTVVFNNAVFSGYALFKEATFSGHAEFKEATFSGNAEFQEATFSGYVLFKGATFRGYADFQEAMFSGRAEFQEAMFLGYAGFFKATFSGRVEFLEAMFSGYAGFKEAKFSGYAWFDKIKCQYGPYLTDSQFNKAPSFHDSTFNQDVDFRRCRFEDTSSNNAAKNYRTLKLAMNKVSNKKQEAVFFALEQDSYRNQPETPKSEKLVSWCYKLLSNYGQSFIRPLVALMLTWISFVSLYSTIKYPVFTKFAENYVQGWPDFAVKLAPMAKFASINIVAPFKVWTGKSGADVKTFFGQEISGFCELGIMSLATLQSLVSLTLITLFILAIRRTYKLS